MTTVSSSEFVARTAPGSSCAEPPGTARPGVDEASTPRISRRRLCRLGFHGLSVAALGGAGYTAWTAALETTRHAVSLGIPYPLRVVAVSDLHLDGNRSKYFDLIERVQGEKPDLIVIVGDTVDYRKGSHAMGINEVISALDAPLGKIATLGNWDHETVDDIDVLRRQFEAAGARLLVNEVCEIAGLRVVGVDDMVLGDPDLRVVEEATSAGPTLLLSHCPGFHDIVLDALPAGTDRRFLTISGHTHGGQIAPFGIVLFTPSYSGSYVAGAYGEEGSSLYVLRGVGTSGLPWRMGARPEVGVFEIS